MCAAPHSHSDQSTDTPRRHRLGDVASEMLGTNANGPSENARPVDCRCWLTGFFADSLNSAPRRYFLVVRRFAVLFFRVAFLAVPFLAFVERDAFLFLRAPVLALVDLAFFDFRDFVAFFRDAAFFLAGFLREAPDFDLVDLVAVFRFAVFFLAGPDFLALPVDVFRVAMSLFSLDDNSGHLSEGSRRRPMPRRRRDESCRWQQADEDKPRRTCQRLTSNPPVALISHFGLFVKRKLLSHNRLLSSPMTQVGFRFPPEVDASHFQPTAGRPHGTGHAMDV